MVVPSPITPDARLRDGYVHGCWIGQLVLLLLVARHRLNSLRRPARMGASKDGPVQTPLLFRLPHIACCLAHVVINIFIIATGAGDDELDNAPQAFYTIATVCAVAMWATCAALVLAEQRSRRHSGRLLRVWWLLNFAIAVVEISSNIVRIVEAANVHHDASTYTVLRTAAFVPSAWLAMIALFARDTPIGEQYSSATLPGRHEPLLSVQHTSQTRPTPGGGSAQAPPPSAEEHTSFASKLTFSYMSGLLATGRRRALEHTDLFDLEPDDASLNNEKEFARALAQGGSFLRCWHRAYGTYFWMTGLLQLLNTCCTFANPLLLNAIVKYIHDPKGSGYTPAEAVLLAVGMFAANSLKSLILGQYFWRGFRLGLRTRAAVGQVVYAKALSLAHEERQQFGTGAIVSFMQIDAQKLADALPYMHLLWQGPLQLGVATYMLYHFMGPAGLASLGVMILSTPLNTWLGKMMAAYTRKTMGARDKRVKFTNEILQGMKILKYFAWEPAMGEQLGSKRTEELRAVRKNMLMGGVMSFVFTALPLLVTASSFALYSIPGAGKKTPDNPDGKLTAAIAYTALSLFQVLRFPLLVVPMMITRLMDLIVVDGRLTKFFRAKERPLSALTDGTDAPYEDFDPSAPIRFEGHYVSRSPPPAGTTAVELSSCTFKWPEPKEEEDAKGKGKGKGKGRAKARRADGPRAPLAQNDAAAAVSGSAPAASEAMLPPTLLNLTIKLPQGGLVGVAGPVGCGKSTLLAAIVGDVPRMSGRVTVRGTIALCTQEAWIQNATVRDNILFGMPYDPQYYAQVLAACALEADLATLSGGDATEIGERGVNLSGGQKARVALARACYARASIVLLDDVLAAVDAEVGAHLVSRCINGLLRERGALVVFITHHTHWLHECDHVIQLDPNGSISAQGAPSTLSGLLPERSGSASASSTNLSALDDTKAAGSAAPAAAAPAAPAKKESASDEGARKKRGKQMADEDRERGTVASMVWLRYAKALGWCNVWLGLVGASVISQVLNFGSSYWLGIWSDDKAPRTLPDGEQCPGSFFHGISGGKPWFYLIVYCAMALVAMSTILVRSVVTAYASVGAGRRIHDVALKAVFASPAAFFDVTPVGRILNRFSGDVQKVDVQLASALSQFISYVVSLVCTLAILFLNSTWTLIAVPPLGYLYLIYSSYYRNSAREVQRLDSISKSPIYAAFGEALNGATTIQAYAANARFEEANRQKVDYNLRANYISLAANRWLTVRLEFFSNILLFLTAVLAVIDAIQHLNDAHGSAGCSGGGSRATAAGLALTYAPGLTDTLNFLIRQFTTLETQMVSVERLTNYAELPPEPLTHGDAVQPDAQWPGAGAITFSGVRMAYRPELPEVLKGMDLRVAAGEKIGIVGRTGAGKSSILVCLYRMAELRAGVVSIDEIDISRVPLPTLRSRLAIIPQDPVLFTGTLRSNLDPTDAHTDEELWRSLSQAGIEAAMAEHAFGLKRPIEERGGNLSMGQRQLLCLCRALLKGSRILVLDEATASVDLESDALIQQTLQHHMGSTTVLTIAHRLETIMHCDRVVAMHEGRVAEAGPPQQLRGTSGSRFAELWEART